jgi:3-hydroxybutyryl-CoA dehydrogenase
MGVKKVGVIGAGQMGNGIALIVAQAGIEVVMRDIEQGFVDKGLKSIEKIVKRNVDKEKITQEEADSILSRITGTLDLSEAGNDADMIIEAIIENMDLKKSVFKELDGVCPDKTIFATNTSSLSITEIASVTKRQAQFLGLHFFNPVPVMKLVEIIKGFMTSDETVATARDLMIAVGKEPIEVSDSPGFAVNRILVPMLNDAIYALMEGVASKEDIDKGMKLGCNHPMGPFELLDFVGLDTTLSIMEYYYQEFGDSKFRPCPLLRQMVRAGLLGRKVGKGFYDYS